jgi:hypothetical protein
MWTLSAWSAGPVALREPGGLAPECGQVGQEHRLEETRVLDAWSADHLTQFKSPQAGRDDVLGRRYGEPLEPFQAPAHHHEVVAVRPEARAGS